MSVFEIGSKAQHLKYGIVTIKGESSSGIRVEYEIAPEDLDGDTEDVVCVSDLQAISPYSHDEVISAIQKHFSILFDPADQVCITFLQTTKNIENFCGPLTKVSTRTAIARLQIRNETSNAYIAMNPLAPGAEHRKKELAGTPRNCFMEVDENGEETLAAVRASVLRGDIPRPSTILQSSPGKYQFVWRINSNDFTMEKVEAINDALVRTFGGDPACTDCLRLFRIPTLRNLKYPQKPVVEVVEALGGGPYNFGDFKLSIDSAKAPVVRPAAADEELSSIASYFEAAAQEAHLHISEIKKWGGNGWLWETTCPWLQEHTAQKDSGSVVILHKSGALDYHCAHGHCSGRNWPKDMRPKMEEMAGHSLRFGKPVDNVILGDEKSESSIPVQQYEISQSDGAAVVSKVGEELSLQPIKNLDTVSSQMKEETIILPFDRAILKGFYSDLVGLVTDGNTLPPQFIFGIAKTLVGLRCAGKTRLEGCDKQPRYYYMMIGETGAGKGESWRRTRNVLTMNDSHLGFDQILRVFNSADSGAGLKESFFDKNGQGTGIPVALYIDEIVDLGSKTRSDRNPEILSTMLELANGTSVSRIKANTTWTCNNAKLGVIMCAQPTLIPVSFANMKGGELGWYDRLTPEVAYSQEIDDVLKPINSSQAIKVSMAFDALPYDSLIKDSPKASDTILQYWKSLSKEERAHPRRLDHIYIDMYMLAFGRRSEAVTVEDALWAIYLDKRQQPLRKEYFTEDVPDKAGDYSRRIKVVIKSQVDAIRAGNTQDKVMLSERGFMTLTNAYRKNEEIHFKKAWNSIVDTLLRPVDEVATKGGRPTKHYMPRM